MKDLRVFISYSHDDGGIATPLSNLLQTAFGPVLVEAFVDRSAISFGESIKTSVLEALERADVLIAVLAGGQPASLLSWPAFEIGTFLAFWEDKHYKQGPHKDRKKGGVLGRVFALVNQRSGLGRDALGPLQGQRPVNLGISERWLSESGYETELVKAKNAASVENDELVRFLKDIEELVKDEPDYTEYSKGRTKSLAELARDYKLEAFDVLRSRVRGRSKPTKQLIVRTKSGGHSLKDDVKLISVAGASEVFGKSEGDPKLFKKRDEGVPGSERYEATWGEFKASVKDHPYGPYWCGVIEQAVTGAAREDSEVDPNLVLISNKGQRYRIIATTITTYFNNDVEVSLYLVEGLHRIAHGDPETSKLLNLMTIICRFRFAFLENSSPFYWLNFKSKATTPKDLLVELDFLKSEATNANLERPGVYEEFMGADKVSKAMEAWEKLELELRNACGAALLEADVAARRNLTEKIVPILKTMYEQIRPLNSLIGIGVAERLLNVFKRNQ